MEDQEFSRTQKRTSQKRRKKLKIAVIVLVVLIAVFVILGAVVKLYPFDVAWDKTADAFKWIGEKISSIWSNDNNGAPDIADIMPKGKKTANILVGVTKEVDKYSLMTTLMLFSYDSRDGTASLIYFPNDLMVNVPGSGLEQLINLIELDEGRFGMTQVTIENILGIDVDRYILALDRDVRIILNQIAENYAVDVTKAVSWKDESLDVKVNLKPGQQNLSGNVLSSYLTNSQVGREADLIERQTSFVPTFLETSKQRLGAKGQLAKKNANLFDTNASGEEIWGFWAELARMDPDKITQVTIPTEEFRFEQTIVHRLNKDKLPAFEKKYVNKDSKISGEDRVKVELLNGCGIPAVGYEIASKLDLSEFNIVNSGNAENFEYPESVIIVYGDDKDKEMVSAAERVRNALEVGRIEYHDTVNDLADITAIIGKDYSSK